MGYLHTDDPDYLHAEVARIQQRLIELCAARRAESIAAKARE